MKTIQTTGDAARPVVVDDDASGVIGEIELASADDVTFPGAWKDGQRLYDVEIWHDGELIATVPPQSEDVDASFAEHERRRSS